jgi:hypothetical protein
VKLVEGGQSEAVRAAVVLKQLPSLTEEGYEKVRERSIGKVGSTLYEVYNVLLDEKYVKAGGKIKLPVAVQWK